MILHQTQFAPLAIGQLGRIPAPVVINTSYFKDRQQVAGHDSRYITLLCGYYIYNIILYIKL